MFITLFRSNTFYPQNTQMYFIINFFESVGGAVKLVLCVPTFFLCILLKEYMEKPKIMSAMWVNSVFCVQVVVNVNQEWVTSNKPNVPLLTPWAFLLCFAART